MRPLKNTSPRTLCLSICFLFWRWCVGGGVCEGLLCSVHSSSYSGGKQKSDRQIYYSVIDITDAVHNKAGHLLKTKQCWCCSGEPWHFWRVSLSGGWSRELINLVCTTTELRVLEHFVFLISEDLFIDKYIFRPGRK